MRATLHTPAGTPSVMPGAPANFQTPYFQARNHARYLELEILMPDVPPESVQVSIQARSLAVIGRKLRAVRANWQAAHFEAVQQDYLLQFPLGRELDPRGLETTMRDGVLSVRLPKAARGRWPKAR